MVGRENIELLWDTWMVIIIFELFLLGYYKQKEESYFLWNSATP